MAKTFRWEAKDVVGVEQESYLLRVTDMSRRTLEGETMKHAIQLIRGMRQKSLKRIGNTIQKDFEH